MQNPGLSSIYYATEIKVFPNSPKLKINIHVLYSNCHPFPQIGSYIWFTQRPVQIAIIICGKVTAGKSRIPYELFGTFLSSFKISQGSKMLVLID